jgi:hypothetical protein
MVSAANYIVVRVVRIAIIAGMVKSRFMRTFLRTNASVDTVVALVIINTILVKDDVDELLLPFLGG